MVNALDACQPRLLEAYGHFPTLPLSLDSGAFQGNTNLDGYCRVGERFVWVANLDVIGDGRRERCQLSLFTEDIATASLGQSALGLPGWLPRRPGGTCR